MNMQTPRSVRTQGGFTLIELIVVIVILGILAATALPKFADLGADARYAALKAAKGSIESASSLAHGKYLMTNTSPVSLDGTSVTLVNGYPAAGSVAAAAGLSSTDWTATTGNGTVTFYQAGTLAAKQAKCSLTYTEAAANGSPQLTFNAINGTSDC